MHTVNSHNEWDKLEEVIVGAGVPNNLPAIDYTFKLFFHDNIHGRKYDDIHNVTGDIPKSYITKRHVEEHNEDIEEFANLLSSLGVVVKRPKIPKKIHRTATPVWESTVHPALNVRDLTVVIGNEIIETPASCRWRYFENDYLKHLFLEYFKQGCKWTQVPRPIMTDNSFDLSYFSKNKSAYDEYKSLIKSDPLDCGYEIMFDAANIMRLGTHILFNASTENAKLGVQWLRSHLSDKYTIWDINIADSHIDSSFLPLRPGLALITREGFWDKLPAPLQKWDKIYIPQRDRSSDEYLRQGIRLASPRIELNVFSVSPDLIICHPEYEKELNNKLNPYGITAIGSRMRHCEIFAGAHHCTTLDIRRKGELQNYFT
jgi:glycine amidinotransferase